MVVGEGGVGSPCDDDFSVFYEKPTSNFLKITTKNSNITTSLDEVSLSIIIF